jgi:hypothetical protein
MRLTALHPLVGFCACLAAPTLALPVRATLAAETYRVLLPAVGTLQTAVLLVPGCSGFTARTGFNLYEERAAQLQAAGYYVVFVDYLTRRHLKDCAGGRDVSHAEVGKDILEAAVWASGQLSIRHWLVVWRRWCAGCVGDHVPRTTADFQGGHVLPRLSSRKAVVLRGRCRIDAHGGNG